MARRNFTEDDDDADDDNDESKGEDARLKPNPAISSYFLDRGGEDVYRRVEFFFHFVCYTNLHNPPCAFGQAEEIR